MADEVVEKAKRMGWVDKEDFKGDPEKWVEAERFVERGENELPIMRERLKKLDGTVMTLNQTIESMRGTYAEYQQRQHDLEERAYKRALKDLTAKQKEAVKLGDEAAFDALEQEKSELKAPEPVKPVKTESAAEKEFKAWVEDNKWYLDDKELQAYASTVSTYVQARDGLPDGRSLYEAVKKEVQLRFPEKFENQNRKKRSVVVGDSDDPPPKSTEGRTFADLPKEAQQQCLRFMKDIPGFTKKEL